MRLSQECDAIVDYLYQDGTHTISCKIQKAKHISGLSNETHRPTGSSGPQGVCPQAVLVAGGPA